MRNPTFLHIYNQQRCRSVQPDHSFVAQSLDHISSIDFKIFQNLKTLATLCAVQADLCLAWSELLDRFSRYGLALMKGCHVQTAGYSAV